MRKCIIESKGQAIFHQWGQGFLVQEHFEVCAMGTVAICELPDGSIIKPAPESIKFLDLEQPSFKNVKQLISEYEHYEQQFGAQGFILAHDAKQEIELAETILNK